MTLDKNKSEAQFANTLRQVLEHQSADVSDDVRQRLRQARVHALQNKGPATRHQRAWQPQLAGLPGRIMDTLGGSGDQRRIGLLAMMAPLAVGAAVLFGSWMHTSQSHPGDDSVNTDTELLTDELPPKAYVDPDFLAYLKASTAESPEASATQTSDRQPDGAR